MPHVSVVVPCSSQKDAVRTTIDSILKQTYQDFELIISDDGSTDGTGTEMLAYLGPDPARAEEVWRESLHEETGTRSIQMIHSEVLVHYLNQAIPRGLGAARNRAVSVATGDYIAFAQPGDNWTRKKLAVQVEILDTHRDLHALVMPKSGTPKKPANRKKPVPALVEFEESAQPPGLRITGSILRRNCLESDAPFDENLPSCEEFDFWLRLASRFQIGRLADGYQSTVDCKRGAGWSNDRYCVYSLEKSFQSGHLSPLQRYRVAEVLADRCGCLSQGYRQRDNLERASFYDRKQKRFVSEVEKLDVSDPLFIGKRPGRSRLTGAAT